MPLNYYAVNQVLGGTMLPGRRQRFGGFGTLRTVGDLLRQRPRKVMPVEFTYDMDARVVQAFEAVRDGTAPERILWDEKLSARFHARCRSLGVHAPNAQLDRRLINIRKNKTRYLSHGIALSETTVTDPQPSIVPEYAHVLEFALVRLRNRYGVSIDDILLDTELVAEFEALARMAARNLTSPQLRLGALYIRKTRHVARAELPRFDELDSRAIESRLSSLGTLDSISPEDVDAKEGLIEVLERDRYLYISRNENLRAVVTEFVQGSTLEVLSNLLWTPRPDSISLRVFAGATFQNSTILRWQLKLIREKQPVFNWPILAA